MPEHDVDRYLPLKPRVFVILLILRDGPLHGYGILGEMESRSEGSLEMDPGLLYRTIARLRDEGLVVETERPPEDDDARRKYYALTELGDAVVMAEAERQVAMLQQIVGPVGVSGQGSGAISGPGSGSRSGSGPADGSSPEDGGR